MDLAETCQQEQGRGSLLLLLLLLLTMPLRAFLGSLVSDLLSKGIQSVIIQ